MMIAIRQLVMVGLGSCWIASLSGCAMMHSYHETKNECINSNVLYTNLAKPATGRVYHLKDGRNCTSFYQKDSL